MYEAFERLTDQDKMVCEKCFGDHDLKHFIKNNGRTNRCYFCAGRKNFCLSINEITEHIFERFSIFYGLADDTTPFAEGQYLGPTFDTTDLIKDLIGVEESKLTTLLEAFFGENLWGHHDWGELTTSEQYDWKWQNFCHHIKHKHRFFFHHLGKSDISERDEELTSLSFEDFLTSLCVLIDRNRLIQTEDVGYKLFRARKREPGEKLESVEDLGPAPEEKALTSNRMNPPGIPVFYGSETKQLAITEVRNPLVSVGTFVSNRALKLLNLSMLEEPPGVFSTLSKIEVGEWKFLKQFANEIRKPIDGTSVTQLDYIPTQVLTEFFRNYSFSNGKIDGIKYTSAVDYQGTNVAIFASMDDVTDIHNQMAGRNDKLLTLIKSETVEVFG